MWVMRLTSKRNEVSGKLLGWVKNLEFKKIIILSALVHFVELNIHWRHSSSAQTDFHFVDDPISNTKLIFPSIFYLTSRIVGGVLVSVIK